MRNKHQVVDFFIYFFIRTSLRDVAWGENEKVEIK